MEHCQETHDTPCWQKHNGEVHQVVREEVDAPGRQVETHTIIDREKRPQYHLKNIEDAVKWCANTRAYNRRGVGDKIQERGDKKRFIGAALPFGESFFAASNLRSALIAWAVNYRIGGGSAVRLGYSTGVWCFCTVCLCHTAQSLHALR